MINKNDWPKTKAMFNAWREKENERALVAAFAPGDPGSKLKYNMGSLSKEDKALCWTDPELIVKCEVESFENIYFAGEAFPLISVNLGPASMAGCYKNANYEFTDNSVWHYPSLDDIETESIILDKTQPIYKAMIEITKYAADMSDGRYFISVPDNAGILDALASLRGSENLLTDFIDNPRKVKAAAAKIQQD